MVVFISWITFAASLILSSHSLAYAGEKTLSGAYEFILPKGLNPENMVIPKDNPVTREKVELGRALFFDSRLSVDDTVSCSTCHNPSLGFTDQSVTSTGVGGIKGDRSAPTIINRVFSKEQFWDGRSGSLEEQAKGPLINPIEMGMPDHKAVERKISDVAGYRAWFKKVFRRDVNIDDLARAIAAFERAVVSGDSPFDAYSAGETDALTDSQKKGLALFAGKAKCGLCHTGPNFTDEKFHNIGVGWDTNRIDLGRYRVTGQVKDIGAQKTPTLREIEHTAPYMHDGSVATLAGVVEFYDKGGVVNPFLAPEMRTASFGFTLAPQKPQSQTASISPLNLTRVEKADIVAFLKALSGKGWSDMGRPESLPE